MTTWSARSPTPALPVIVLGVGGHARVLIATLRLIGARIVGCSGHDTTRPASIPVDIDFLGGEDAVFDRPPASVYLVNGLGSVASGGRRDAAFDRFKAKGYRFAQVVHPAAVMASSIALGEGIQIMAGAIVQPGCSIGDNTLINIRAAVDHDCLIGSHVHIAPGAVLSGGVSVGNCAHIGTGATVIQGIAVGEGSLVAAGATVIEPVADHVAVAGMPAHVMVS